MANINSQLMLSACRKLWNMDLWDVWESYVVFRTMPKSIDNSTRMNVIGTCTAHIHTPREWIRLLSRKYASLSTVLFNHKSLKLISFSANTINIYEFELRFIVFGRTAETLQHSFRYERLCVLNADWICTVNGFCKVWQNRLLIE